MKQCQCGSTDFYPRHKSLCKRCYCQGQHAYRDKKAKEEGFSSFYELLKFRTFKKQLSI